MGCWALTIDKSYAGNPYAKFYDSSWDGLLTGTELTGQPREGLAIPYWVINPMKVERVFGMPNKVIRDSDIVGREGLWVCVGCFCL